LNIRPPCKYLSVFPYVSLCFVFLYVYICVFRPLCKYLSVFLFVHVSFCFVSLYVSLCFVFLFWLSLCFFMFCLCLLNLIIPNKVLFNQPRVCFIQMPRFFKLKLLLSLGMLAKWVLINWLFC
jgi:hypothetical protein